MEQIVFALLTIAIGIFGALFYFYGSNWLLEKIFPANHANLDRAVTNMRRASMIRPFLFLGPALISLGIYLVYPLFSSIAYSFYDKNGVNFVGLANYRWLLADSEFHEAIFNNILWLLVVPTASTLLGLIIATLTDRIWWGNLAKSLIFMPMAISFVGASVIWKFVYDYRDAGQSQIGLLNAVIMAFGGDPQVWIALPFFNNFFLMVILIWIETGFAMVLLSAALRGIPEETIEAAIIDGANPWQIFIKIKVPQIWGTIAVVWTTITILVLKVFDIVLAMTNGQWQSQVLANLMFNWMFRGGGDFGKGAVIAVVIMLMVLPIMVWNIRNARRDMPDAT